MKAKSIVVFVCLVAALPAQTVVSLNKAVTVSSNYSTSPGSYAVDGNASTGWAANGSIFTSWLLLDLGQVYALDQITLLGPNGVVAGNTNIYNLSRSTDNSTWTTVGSGTLIDTSDPSDVWVLGGASGGYIKYEVTGGTHWPGLSEMTVTAVPEPSTYAALAGLGALGFAGYRRRRRQAT